ncbi:MAG: DNA-binding domain-containing protein [Paracoccaceae bacterium]
MSQSEFRAALLNPDLPAPAGLTDPAGRPAGRRFDVYRNNVTYGLTEALRRNFPLIEKLVGAPFFAAMARDYLRAHPPTSPLIMAYGGSMPDFLASFPPVARLPYLPDVARLELAIIRSYHAADAPLLPPQELASVPADRLADLHLRFCPSAILLRSDWPIHAIWAANMQGGAPPPDLTRAEDVLIARPDYDPKPLLLPPGAAGFVARLMAGESLGQAVGDGPEFDLTATLGLLISSGALAGPSLKDNVENAHIPL